MTSPGPYRPNHSIEHMFVVPLSASREVIELATGKKSASAASKVLKDPKATKAEKTAAASDLAQTPKKK